MRSAAHRASPRPRGRSFLRATAATPEPFPSIPGIAPPPSPPLPTSSTRHQYGAGADAIADDTNYDDAIADDADGAPAPSAASSFPGWPAYAADAPSLFANQVAVGLAVLSDGKPEARLRLCFDAFDSAGCAALGSDALVGLLHAIYRTHYKQPPTDDEVRAAAHVIFSSYADSHGGGGHGGGANRGGANGHGSGGGEMGLGAFLPENSRSSSSNCCHGSGSYGGSSSSEPLLPRDGFLRLAMSQPTLVQCFAKRGARPLLTPRGVSQRDELPIEQSAFETLASATQQLLLPACAFRDKPRHHKGPIKSDSVQPKAARSPLLDDRHLAAEARARGAASPSPGLFGGLLDGFSSLSRSFFAFETHATASPAVSPGSPGSPSSERGPVVEQPDRSISQSPILLSPP